MKRRAKGTGTIVKVGSIYYGRIMVNGKVKKVRLCANQRDAEAQWKEWVRQNVNSIKTDATRHPLENLWAMVEESWKLAGKSQKAIMSDKFRFNAFISYLQKSNVKFLEEVTKLHILNFFESECGNMAYGTTRKYRSMMKSIWKTAMPDVPCPADSLKLKKTSNVAREPFTDAELNTILNYAETMGHSWKVLIEVGLYTGLRLKDCVHLHSDFIKDGVIMLTPFKTKQKGITVRIPLHPTLDSELKSLGIANGYYFPEQIKCYKGKYSKYSNEIMNRLRKIFSQIGTTSTKAEGHARLVSIKGFHALRATFITRLAERGVSLPIMESLAGHINPQQTMHYTHPDEEVKTAAINVLPDFGKIDYEEKSFIHPEVQRVIQFCKKQIAETMEQYMGKKVDVKISANEILGGAEAFFNL